MNYYRQAVMCYDQPMYMPIVKSPSGNSREQRTAAYNSHFKICASEQKHDYATRTGTGQQRLTAVRCFQSSDGNRNY